MRFTEPWLKEMIDQQGYKNYRNRVNDPFRQLRSGGSNAAAPMGGVASGMPGMPMAGMMSSRGPTAQEMDVFNDRNRNRALYGDRWNTNGGIGRPGIMAGNQTNNGLAGMIGKTQLPMYDPQTTEAITDLVEEEKKKRRLLGSTGGINSSR